MQYTSKNEEALEACKALARLSEEEQKLVFRKVSQPEPAETVQKPTKEKGDCPHRGSSHVNPQGVWSRGKAGMDRKSFSQGSLD